MLNIKRKFFVVGVINRGIENKIGLEEIGKIDMKL